MAISRKHFIKQACAITLGFSGLQIFTGCNSVSTDATSEPFFKSLGPLRPDPAGILDLPDGFSYKVISEFGKRMDDGLYVPHRPDGMAAFPGPDGLTILIRNHEVNAASGGSESAFGADFEMLDKLSPADFYDYGHNVNPGQGGTTTVIYDTKNQEVIREFLSLAGTIRNCSGGPTPWNSWLSCEEIVMPANNVYAKDHGYVFEVPATTNIQLADPVPIKAMGRFNHEAVAVDPNSGIIYLTEDESDGLFYRFIPHTPGRLHSGGRLQALVVENKPGFDTRNWDSQTAAVGQEFSVQWIDLENIDNPADDLRLRGFNDGAARFARGEGMWFGNDAIYFACTNGGVERLGQIWKYVPTQSFSFESPGQLELFVESTESTVIENADNLTAAPSGDLIACEDAQTGQHLKGITPAGEVYEIAKNVKSNSELAGASFSPDGSTLFMNIQHDGLTLAITGPWQR